MIEIKDVKKSFKDIKALKGISIDIFDSEIFGLLGVNGAGKSTLIKILSGLLKKDSGEIIINGLDVDKDIYEIKKIINISPQETSIAPKLTVLENLEFIANLYGINDDKKINSIIEEFKLDEVKNQKSGTLSGGYQRRLSIAMCMVTNPSIIFLDEPTLGLDVIARRELWNIINKLKSKVTIILTTHYLEEAFSLCDRIAILKKGELKAVDTPDNLKILGKSENIDEAFINIVGVE